MTSRNADAASGTARELELPNYLNIDALKSVGVLVALDAKSHQILCRVIP